MRPNIEFSRLSSAPAWPGSRASPAPRRPTSAAPCARPMSPNFFARWISRPPRAAAAKCTSPTGLPGVAPPGPAMPVIATARSASECASAPCAIASAVSRLTAPCRSSVSGRHAEHRLLGGVRIGDEAALDHVGRAGDFGQRAGDQPAGAGFRGRDRQAARAGRARAARLAAICAVAHGALHGSRIVAVAIAAMPSRAAGEAELLAGGRLDADAVDRDAGDLGDARAHGVAMRADLRGLAHDGDIEMGDAAAALGARARPRTRRKRSEEAPRHCGSLGGKCAPMSPSASAPRIASTSACSADVGVGMAGDAALVRRSCTPPSQT